MLPEKTIVDCLGTGQLFLGVINRPGDERVQIEDAAGRLSKIPASQIIASYELSANRKLTEFSVIQGKIQTQLEQIDTELFWNDWLENGGKAATISELAKQYFGNELPENTSAMGRHLVSDNLHYQRQGREFTPRTAEGVKEMQRMLALRAEKAQRKERVRAWLLAVLDAPQAECPVAVPEDSEQFVQQSLDYLLLGFNSEWVNLLATVRPKFTARETALLMLRKTNRLPDDVDETLVVNGIHAGFAQNVLEAANNLADYQPGQQNRESWTGEEIFSIDDESTREIDDALSIHQDGDVWIVGIHLANPSYFIHKNDELDQVAIDRPLSLYLPTTTVTMFPETLGCNKASLNLGEIRPSFSFKLQVDDQGNILDWNFIPSEIQVTSHISYEQADAMLESGSDTASDKLRQLLKIAKTMQAQREADGAISLNKPEIRVTVKKDQITVHEESQDSPSHCLVQEFMVIANHLAACYALRNDVPIIYRTQDPPLESATSVRPYNPILFDREVRKMRRTRLSTYPQTHAGLGLDIYTQISSPLRRYADLVIQRQIAAHLLGEPIPYTQEELFGVLDNVERTSAQNRSLERETRRYWLLEYLRRNYIGREIMATIVRLEGYLVLAEIDKYYERGVVMTRETLHIGERYLVRIIDVKPKLGRLTLELA